MENIKKKDLSFWTNALLPLLAVAVSWGIMLKTLESQDKRIYDIEKRLDQHEEWGQIQHEKLNSTYIDIQVQLAGIQKDIIYIKTSLDGKANK